MKRAKKPKKNYKDRAPIPQRRMATEVLSDSRTKRIRQRSDNERAMIEDQLDEFAEELEELNDILDYDEY